ncbi:MAG TPA: nuclear transport factor 2 family protein [Allosphingosinicella sp.]
MSLITALNGRNGIGRALAGSTLAGLALLAACSRSANDNAAEMAAPPTEAEVAAVVDRTEATFTSGNAETIMAHYAPGAVFFDPSVAEPTDDRATATKWTENFVSMKPTAFSPGARKIQVLDSDTFITSGVGTIDAVVDDRPTKLAMRYTDVYEKQADGSWLIVHEHLSMPPKGAAAAQPTPAEMPPATNAATTNAAATNAAASNTAEGNMTR